MKFIPKNNYLLVEALTEEEKVTSSGIIIPTTVGRDEQLAQGKVVVSCSDEYKPDDIVLFNKLTPDDINIKVKDNKEKTYWSINISDIMFILKNENN